MNLWDQKNTMVYVVFLCAGMAGCSTARVVAVQPHRGGVVAVNPPQDSDARAKAFALMTDNCGSAGYEITEEGEHVVGSTRNSSASASRGLFGRPMVTGSSRSYDQTEWRITYKCKGA